MIGDTLIKQYDILKNTSTENVFRTNRIRDLLITELTKDFWMVVACDSAGGIGPKKNDSVHVPGYELGRLCARVPIIEILSSGAYPISIIDTLTVEMDPTGKHIIKGVKEEAKDAGINGDLAVTGSTEDNVKTFQSGIGVTVIGLVSKKDFKPGNSNEGDIVVCIGIPKSAPEYKIVYDDPEITNPLTIRKLCKLNFVHDILSVGSKGIKYEAVELAKSAGLSFNFYKNLKVDIKKSGGPSTCCLVSLPEKNLQDLKQVMTKPVSLIGELSKGGKSHL